LRIFAESVINTCLEEANIDELDRVIYELERAEETKRMQEQKRWQKH